MNQYPYPVVAADALGWLTEEQMVEVDRVMIDELHIELIQMMENAGRSLARLVLDLVRPTIATVLAGSGGNGGGGLVAARHLANAGVAVTVALTRSADELSGVPAHQLDILDRMGIAVTSDPVDRADVAVDALVGYSLRGAPRGRTARLITEIRDSADAVISLDTPSGLDVTTGETPGVVVRTDATLTLALPKNGLRSAPEVGDLYVADIAVPPQVMLGLGVVPPDFARASVLQVAR